MRPKTILKLSDTTFPSADSSDGATPVVKKGIVNVSLIVTSTTNIKTTISGTESYILITVKDIGERLLLPRLLFLSRTRLTKMQIMLKK